MLSIKTKNLGAELTSVQYNDTEMLFQGSQILDKENKPFWKRQAPILFPIVGQLKDVKTKIEENTYEMSQH